MGKVSIFFAYVDEIYVSNYVQLNPFTISHEYMGFPVYKNF